MRILVLEGEVLVTPFEFLCPRLKSLEKCGRFRITHQGSNVEATVALQLNQGERKNGLKSTKGDSRTPAQTITDTVSNSFFPDHPEIFSGFVTFFESSQMQSIH